MTGGHTSERAGTQDRELVFDAIARSDSTPSAHSEPLFLFLNRVSGEFWGQVRSLIQEWLNNIPSEAEYRELRTRMRSNDDYQFRSAFLELYLHESLIRAGYNVTIHPDVPHSARRPDFHAERNGERFFLEAICPGASKLDIGKMRRSEALFDTVNAIKSDFFFLWIVNLDEGDGPAPATKLRKQIEKWLSRLDPDTYDDFSEWPIEIFSIGQWSLTVKAMPKPVHKRGEHKQAIGVYGHYGAQRIDEAPKILSAISEKHSAYGNLDTPFIVAVGTYMMDSDHWHATNALYGHEIMQIHLEERAGSEKVVMGRDSNGYFGVPSSWIHRQTSAILLVNQLMPHHILQAEATLWRHPNPSHLLADNLGLPWLQIVFNGKGLTKSQAPVESAEFFNLPPSWPTGDPWPPSGLSAEDELAT
ncbi:hypothetical protein IU453_19870 [Nocardia cyriacigeorgica]|uniref:hypothetical protein n=1 Tax=Nocardia cyriacigeorgica TaxID=135487 RepID=UPI0018958B70|nr:hypothetical protein [Nocardia cyriacigeorgica]MBF6319016.1 hypothetical protein [Nocardia cyriacigeorgica]MBF6531473.1 hypothetical protein [Nocardia cyriacigeorgica]